MKKEEVLKVLKDCEIQSYYVHDENILAVICNMISWKELEIIGKDILDITARNKGIRIAIELG